MLGFRGTSISQPSPNLQNLTAMTVPTSNGHTNGHVNGHNPAVGKTTTNGYTIAQKNQTGRTETLHESHVVAESSRTRTFTLDQQVTVLRQTVLTTRAKLICDLAHVDEHYIDSITVESFLEYIEHERLTYMPQRGSRWDKVLKWAEFFALQISGYEKAVGSFVPDSKAAARLIWASCRVLVELGPENSQAIETAFAVFYKVGLSLSFFLQHNELLSLNSHIRAEVGQAFNDLLKLVRDVTLHYRVQISTLSSMEVVLDFNIVFGRNIEAFYGRKDHIIDAMWACKIEDDSLNIHAIRKWLSTRDSTTRKVISDRTAAKGRRDEYTCEWFQRHLLDFSRSDDDVLGITGPSGCGKSILWGWIVERLQRPLGKKSHETLSLIIDTELPNECTVLATAKNLALQLLQINIGDTALLKALQKVYNDSFESRDAAMVENGIWDAIHVGLKNIKTDSLMIVLDGLDDRCGHDTAVAMSERVGQLATRHKHVQAIILARNSAHFTRVKVQELIITPDQTHDDLHHITEHALHGCQHFLNQNDHDREAIVEKLTHAAKGNFVWLQLMARSLKQETSHDGFMKAIKSAKEQPKSLEQLIRNLISSVTADFSKAEANLLLSWLLASERPLTVTEIKSLLQVDIQKKTLVSGTTDVTDDINNYCGPLVNIRNGIVRFRHGTIRECLVKISAEGKKLPSMQAMQADLVTRLLAYCQFRLSSPYRASFERPEAGEMGGLLLQDALLEYAARHWIVHLKKSSLLKSNGTFDFNSEFKVIFPSSVQLTIIEWICWESQTSPLEAAALHDLALRIRQNIFTEKHETVLQTLIICGHLYKKVSKTVEAGTYFYRASHIGQSILKLHSSITLSCTTAFLEVTETTVLTTRTEFVTHKEQLLQYIISAYKQQHGKTSDMVIRYSKALAELYVSIKEEDKAETIWRELHEIMIARYGKGSTEETNVSGHLNVVLKKGEKHDEIIEYERNIFDTSTEMEIWDIRRIKVTLKLAAAYEARGELLKAEELYVVLWGGLIEHCHQIHSHHVDIEAHISMIDISLEYVRFLKRHHRHEEAAGILICIWAEYEEYDFESEVIFLRLKVVGELMRVTSLLSVAVSVFKKCWSWFKSHEKQEYTASCQILISETIEEISTTTTTTTTVSTSSTTTTSTESIIKEIFESSMSKSTVTAETVSICQSLVSFYMKSEKWSEAIATSRKSLELVWKMIISGRGTIALPRDFSSEAINIAIHLAICYHRSHQFHEAETVYLRVYRACFNSCHVHDERLTKVYTALIRFYEEHGYWNKSIEIYKGVLAASQKHLGTTHTLTIKTLYILGSLCSEHGHGHAHEYYEEIITVLNGSSHSCHHDAIAAMKIMCRSYFEQGLWQKLKHTCEMLWETWIHHHDEHRIEAEFIELLHMRYIYVLEHHSHAGYEIIRTITIQYRDTCTKVFGASVAITIKALIELAQICMRSEKHVHEAISYYEEVIETTTISTKTITTTTTVSTTTISTVKERLAKAYIHVCTIGAVSSTTIERAILVLTERFEYLKITFGCSHTETLTVLRELVLMYWRQKTKETHSIVVRILVETIVAIVSNEKNSRTLYEAATIIGGIYLKCELLEEGRKLLREMHRQIVSKTYNSSDKCGFKIDHAIGKGSYVFLVTFEEVLQGSVSVSYSKIMADLLTETILYESYTRCLKSEKNVEVILATGSRLYVFLGKSSRKEQLAIVQDELHKIFITKWGSIVKTRTEITQTLLISLLEVLGHSTRHIHIGNAACKSSTSSVRALLEKGRFNDAYDVSMCAFTFIEHQGAYHHLQNIGYGFKLSALMAGRGFKPSKRTMEPELRTKMLGLSRKIIGEVLKACKDSKIDFVRLKLGELNDLVVLLGEQQNYSDLEWLLNCLWSSREVQKNWNSEIIVAIGKRFVQARFLGGHKEKAISLCEAICYNLRRVYGALDPKALELSELLSQVYTAAHHYQDAMRVHEEILRLVVEGDDFDDKTPDTMTPELARHHLDLLKQAYLRLKGWDKKPKVYKDLVDQLLDMPEYKTHSAFQSALSADNWSLKDKLEVTGDFNRAIDWEFVDPECLNEKGDVAEKRHPMSKNHRLGLRRITSNWGMDIHLLGEDADGHEIPYMKSHQPDILVKGPEIKLEPQKMTQYAVA